MNNEHEPDFDFRLRDALERATAHVDIPPDDPVAYAASISGKKQWLGGVLATVGTGALAVVVVLALARLVPSQTASSPTPSLIEIASSSPTAVGSATLKPSPVSVEPSPLCGPVAPTELPNGAPAGELREVLGEVVPMWEWGEGDNAVRQAANHPSYSGAEVPPPDMFTAELRGDPAAIMTVGDSTLSQITITWIEAVCTYTIWIGPGYDVEGASEYASRY